MTTFKFDKKNRLIITLSLLSVLIFTSVWTGEMVIERQKAKRALLSVTQPVYSLTATVKEVSGNKLIVSHQNGLPASPPAFRVDETYAAAASPEETVLTFITNSETTIETAPSDIPLLVKQNKQPKKLSLSDLKPGQKVYLTSKEDMRRTNDQLTVSSIQAVFPSFQINANVKEVKGKTLIITCDCNNEVRDSALLPPDQRQIRLKELTIEVQPETEINYVKGNSPKSDQMIVTVKLADLKPNSRIIVYTTSNPKDNKIIAERIQPLTL